MILKLSRATATRRLTQGELSADETIQLSRSLNVEPVMALVDLGYITHSEVISFLGDSGFIATADDGELAIELARRLNPATKADEIDELEQRRRSNESRTFVHTESNNGWKDAVAYSGPDEDKLRNDAHDDE